MISVKKARELSVSKERVAAMNELSDAIVFAAKQGERSYRFDYNRWGSTVNREEILERFRVLIGKGFHFLEYYNDDDVRRIKISW